MKEALPDTKTSVDGDAPSSAAFRLLANAIVTIDNAAIFTCKLALVAMASVVLVQVVLRYVLNSPVSWAEEATLFLMLWVAFIGAGVGLSRNAHISTDFLVSRLPTKSRRLITLISSTLVLGFLCLLMYYGTAAAIAQYGQLSPGFRIPMSYPYAVIPLSALYMSLVCIRSLLDPDETHRPPKILADT